jgi:hypothetical protein
MYLYTALYVIFVFKLYRLTHENKPLDVFPSTPEYDNLFDVKRGESMQCKALMVFSIIRHPASPSNMVGGNDNPEADEREKAILQIAAESMAEAKASVANTKVVKRELKVALVCVELISSVLSLHI